MAGYHTHTHTHTDTNTHLCVCMLWPLLTSSCSSLHALQQWLFPEKGWLELLCGCLKQRLLTPVTPILAGATLASWTRPAVRGVSSAPPACPDPVSRRSLQEGPVSRLGHACVPVLAVQRLAIACWSAAFSL